MSEMFHFKWTFCTRILHLCCSFSSVVSWCLHSWFEWFLHVISFSFFRWCNVVRISMHDMGLQFLTGIENFFQCYIVTKYQNQHLFDIDMKFYLLKSSYNLEVSLCWLGFISSWYHSCIEELEVSKYGKFCNNHITFSCL